MKKLFRKSILFLLISLFCLSVGGCSLFQGNGGTSNSGKVPGYEATLPNSSLLTEKVEFGTIDEADRVYNRVKAVANVSRSVVAILYPYQNQNGEIEYGGGSGVIVDISTLDGETKNESENEFYILTCAHVLGFTGEFYVYVPDKNGRNFTDSDYDQNFIFGGMIGNEIYTNQQVTLVGGDKNADIAVLKLDITGATGVSARDIVECKIAPDNYSLSLGEDVFAVGNPSGQLPMTVSNGIVSYIDREVLIEGQYMNLVQIDVQINHGNSGGGLFNYYGELVGITNGGSEVYDGINYAIPFKNVYAEEDNGFVTIAKQLIATKTSSNYGYVSGRWILGITTTNSKHPETNGDCLIVSSVVAGSNAEKSGLIQNDVITTVKYTSGGEDLSIPVTSNVDFLLCFAEIKQNHSVGDSFLLVVERKVDGAYEERTIRINITEQFIFCDTGR
ncbi:MAG: trypsin-like peptidase domain-containing protein [Clostridia bacterium]|nr:trypsin-like peptidase domain-containing protein [Clostridia bacterium]